MRKILLASAAAPALLYALPSQAQTCTAAPDCATLGYTKTASQCSGKSYTRCPFDTSKYACDTPTSTQCYEQGFTDSKANCVGNYIACPGNDTYVRCLQNAKPGDLKYSLRTKDHDGWLLCNGKEYEPEEYPELFAIIGGVFGKTRPNYKGYFLKGAATGTVADFGVGESAGLPNITGKFGMTADGVNIGWNNAVPTTNNAFYRVDGIGDKGTSSNNQAGGVGFDASRSNPIYGRSTTVTPQNYKANIFIYAGRKMSGQSTCEQSGYLNSEPEGYHCTQKTVGSTKCYTNCEPKTVLEKCLEKYPGTAYNDDGTTPYPNSEGWCYGPEYETCGLGTRYQGDAACAPYADEVITSCLMDVSCMSSQYGISL